ncbi:MAG: hypothetical protein KF688_13095 [Pirellulales bacterium]|nr:hypothetical protein [Pirellulales bacterium]
MTGTPMTVAELLADCNTHGVRLAARDGGGLAIDAPQAELTPGLLEALTARKAELLAMLLPTDATAVCRCGSTAWRDVVIHGGQSVRRDCAICGRFANFPIWNSRPLFD